MRELFDRALARRAPLLTENTNAVRLIDGEGDGLPGIVLESFAGNWLVSTTTEHIPAAARDWLESAARHASGPHALYAKHLDQHQKDPPAHLAGPEVPAPFLIRENGAAFEISFQSGYSQGIFLDQRDNRLAVRQRLRPGQTLLNTFAYTGAFSVAAALAGAQTTTLDLSQPYLDWAKRNFTHNQLDPADHHFCKGDTFHWLRRFAKQGRRFDAIVLDPPTFSRDEKGSVFRVERDYHELASLALACLAPGGWLLCCTNCRTLPMAGFRRMIHLADARPLHLTSARMPRDFTGDPYLKSVWVQSQDT
jgi:23S rRNA (cytosine1962-C5)-methyltransferase